MAAKRTESATQEDLRLRCQELLAYRMSVDEEAAAAKRQDALHVAAAQARLDCPPHLSWLRCRQKLTRRHQSETQQLAGEAIKVNS